VGKFCPHPDRLAASTTNGCAIVGKFCPHPDRLAASTTNGV